MRAHVEAQPQPPSTINPRVPAALDRIVTKAVAKDPAMRFQSAGEFRQALQRFALDTRTAPQPAIPRKPRQAILSTWRLRLPEIRPARQVAVIALAPILLVGFYAISLFSYAGRARSPEIVSESVIRAQVDPVKPPSDPQPGAVVEPPTAESPITTKKSTTIASLSAKPPAKVERPSSQPSTPAAIVPAPIPEQESAQLVEPPKADEPVPSSPIAASPDSPVAEATPATLPSGDASPANPPTGNRFLRTLGKVNPFRRLLKRDPAKSVRKPD